MYITLLYCVLLHYMMVCYIIGQEGELVSMKLIVHAASGPLLGSMADRYGRRPARRKYEYIYDHICMYAHTCLIVVVYIIECQYHS